VPRALDARISAVLAGPAIRARYGALHKLVLVAWGVLALGGARRASAQGHATCTYTPQLAAQLYVSHPEADLDGDGTLSRYEACELQAELRHQKEVLSSTPEVERGGLRPTREVDPEAETLLSEPLCCNCDRGGAYSTPDNASCLNE
jgi:hypothetical protein